MQIYESKNPTIVLLFFVLISFGLTTLLLVNFSHPLIYFFVIVLNTILGVLIFTPLHDASHGSASRNVFVNEAVMYFCWPFIIHSPFFFRVIHNCHHVHTGDPKMDPDACTKIEGISSKWGRSFAIFYWYYRYSLKYIPNTSKKWMLLTSSMMGPVVVLWLSLFSSFGTEIMVGLVIPNLMSTGILGFINTAWPHDVGLKSDRLLQTRNLLVPRWLELLMCYQNLHLVHHIRPSLPWYRYREFWAKKSEKYEKLGCITSNYVGKF